jgi:membrane protein YqaA with SNARE-associated domain
MKTWWKSKTLWINTLGIIGAAVSTLPPGTKVIGVVAGVVNIGLRLMTNQPLDIFK